MLLALLLAGIGVIQGSAEHQSSVPTKNRALERALASQARLLFIQNTYGPVDALVQAGQQQEALLKLEEIAGRYPGEAHGLLLKASILAAAGAQAQAVASYAAAVRLQGEYVDLKSPLSRRDEITQVMESGLAYFAPQLKTQPGNISLKQTMRDLYYLKSRLAGGCE